MPRAVSKAGGEGEHQTGYATNLDYLTDELRRLDLLIRLRLLEKQSGQQANPLNHFKGLVLLEEEIVGLLADAGGVASNENLAGQPDPNTRLAAETLAQLAERIEQRLAASVNGETDLFLPR